MKPLDWQKPLMTFGGQPARLLGVLKNPGAKFPYVVAVGKEGEEQIEEYTAEGDFGDDGIQCDLHNVPERIKREVWVNVYPDGTPMLSGVACGFNASRREADEHADTRARLACVKVVIDCNEGDGLEGGK